MKSKYGKVIDEIMENSKTCVMLVNEGEYSVISVKGDAFDLGNMLKKLFDEKPEAFRVIRASVKAYESLQEFEKKTPEEQLEELGEAIKNLGRVLN